MSLPKQWSLHPVISPFEIQETSVQLLAVCLSLINKMLKGKDTVEHRSFQAWFDSRHLVSTELFSVNLTSIA